MKKIMFVLILLAQGLTSCKKEDENRNQPSNNISSLNSIVSSVAGKWQLDSLVKYNSSWVTYDTIEIGTKINLLTSVYAPTATSCNSDEFNALHELCTLGVYSLQTQETWSVIDALCPGTQSVPVAYKYFLDTGLISFAGAGYIETVNSSSLVIVFTQSPLLLPTINSGSRAYWKKIN